MNKYVIATVVAGTIAGAALVGVPAVALATEAEEPMSQTAEMGSMMSDPEMRELMTSHTSEMMFDPQMRDQMRSMMSEVMGDMEGVHTDAGGPGDEQQDDDTR